MVAYGDTGIWSIYFGCDEHDVKRCLRLVRKELDKFMQKPLSEAQLKAAKKQIKGQVGVACDNCENFAPRLRQELPSLWLGEERRPTLRAGG